MIITKNGKYYEQTTIPEQVVEKEVTVADLNKVIAIQDDIISKAQSRKDDALAKIAEIEALTPTVPEGSSEASEK